MKKFGILALIALAIGGGAYYKLKGSKEEETSRKYIVQKVEKTTFETIVEADGVVDAEDTKLVYADRSLKVSELFYDEGDYVEKGQVIMTFDPEDKNTVARNIKSVKIDIKQLERDLKNAEELFDVGGSSKVEIEDIEFDIAQKRLELEDLEEEMSKMLDSIISPFNGTIISMIAEENYRVNTEVELFEMADLSNVIIVAEVPEYDINGVVEGQDVRILPDAYERPFRGVVEKISTLSTETASSSDSSSSSSDSEAYVEVDISMTRVPKELRPGFNADVEIITKFSENTFGIPRAAVLEDKDGNYVFTVSDTNVIAKERVTLGMSNSTLLEVNGLSAGTRVVADPDVTLKDGDIIEVGEKKAGTERKKGKKKGQGGPGGGPGA